LRVIAELQLQPLRCRCRVQTCGDTKRLFFHGDEPVLIWSLGDLCSGRMPELVASCGLVGCFRQDACDAVF
jgi:hypothetical protein